MSDAGGTRVGAARVVPVLAIAALGISSGAVLVRLADSPAPVTAFWRLALSAAILAPALWIDDGWKDWVRMDRADGIVLLASGVCLALHFLAWFRSLDFTSVASSSVLVSAHPLFVGLLSARFLGERPSRQEWLGLAVAVTGAFLVGWGDFRFGPDPLRGDLLAASAAGFAALYIVAGRRLRSRIGLLAYVVPVYGIAALVCLVSVWTTGLPLTGWPASTWWALAGLAIGPTLLGHTGFNWALRHVRAYVVAVVQLFEPLGATALAILVLGRAEVPGWSTLAGGAAIITGVWTAIHARAIAREAEVTLGTGGGD